MIFLMTFSFKERIKLRFLGFYFNENIIFMVLNVSILNQIQHTYFISNGTEKIGIERRR
jgi:hypothetical protein